MNRIIDLLFRPFRWLYGRLRKNPDDLARPWTRGEKMLGAALVLFVINILFAVVIEAQVQGRNERLDQFADAIVEIDVAVDEIREVADTVNQPDPEREAQTARLYAAIFETRQVVCEFPDEPVVELCRKLEEATQGE